MTKDSKCKYGVDHSKEDCDYCYQDELIAYAQSKGKPVIVYEPKEDEN